MRITDVSADNLELSGDELADLLDVSADRLRSDLPVTAQAIHEVAARIRSVTPRTEILPEHEPGDSDHSAGCGATSMPSVGVAVWKDRALRAETAWAAAVTDATGYAGTAERWEDRCSAANQRADEAEAKVEALTEMLAKQVDRRIALIADQEAHSSDRARFDGVAGRTGPDQAQ